MSGMLRVPRSRGALSGAILILLGLWGGLIAFVGPYVDFAYTPDDPWVFTGDRLWMQIAPAVATVLGGLIVLISANRVVAMFGAGLAAAGGLWFIVGGPLSRLWTDTAAGAVGAPIGDETRQVAEQLAFFLGVGALIVFFAALAMGRFAVLGVKEAHLLEGTGAEAVPHGRHERREPAEPQPEWAASSTQPMERSLAPAGSFADRPAGPVTGPAGPAGPATGPQPPMTGAGSPAGGSMPQPMSGPADRPMSRPPAAAPPPVPAGPPFGRDPSVAGRYAPPPPVGSPAAGPPPAGPPPAGPPPAGPPPAGPPPAGPPPAGPAPAGPSAPGRPVGVSAPGGTTAPGDRKVAGAPSSQEDAER